MEVNKASLNKFYQFAHSMCHNSEESFDIVHTCLARCLAKSKLKDLTKSYVYRSIRNEFIDRYRYRGRWAFEEEADGEFQLGDERALEQLISDRQEVTILLDECTPQEKSLLFLWAVEGHSFMEVSKILGIPRGTLLSRVHRLKKRLEVASRGVNESTL